MAKTIVFEMSEEEIKKQAREFADKWIKEMRAKFEITCTACNARNCKCNEVCIQCGCQL